MTPWSLRVVSCTVMDESLRRAGEPPHDVALNTTTLSAKGYSDEGLGIRALRVSSALAQSIISSAFAGCFTFGLLAMRFLRSMPAVVAVRLLLPRDKSPTIPFMYATIDTFVAFAAIYGLAAAVLGAAAFLALSVMTAIFGGDFVHSIERYRKRFCEDNCAAETHAVPPSVFIVRTLRRILLEWLGALFGTTALVIALLVVDRSDWLRSLQILDPVTGDVDRAIVASWLGFTVTGVISFSSNERQSETSIEDADASDSTINRGGPVN